MGIVGFSVLPQTVCVSENFLAIFAHKPHTLVLGFVVDSQQSLSEVSHPAGVTPVRVVLGVFGDNVQAEPQLALGNVAAKRTIEI
jgi:hypothetical protein